MSVVASSYRTNRPERYGPLTWLALNRPRVLNALSAEVLMELLDAEAAILNAAAFRRRLDELFTQGQ